MSGSPRRHRGQCRAAHQGGDHLHGSVSIGLKVYGKSSGLRSFEPQNLPKSEADLGALLDREHVRDAISSAGVRYIVTVSGNTYAGPTGAQPGGYIYTGIDWDRRSDLTFEVWDLKRVKSLGRLTATAKGNNHYGLALIVVPIASWAPTETATCDEITRGLHAIFGPSL